MQQYGRRDAEQMTEHDKDDAKMAEAYDGGILCVRRFCAACPIVIVISFEAVRSEQFIEVLTDIVIGAGV